MIVETWSEQKTKLEEKVNYLECKINELKYHLSEIRDEADYQYEMHKYRIPEFAKISRMALHGVEAVERDNK